MKNRERKARMLASVVHRDAWPSYVLAAGLLAGLKGCARNHSHVLAAAPAVDDIRDAILDAVEKANGGPL